MVNEAGWKLENSYRNLPETFFSEVKPAPGRNPNLIIFNDALAEELGLKIDYFKSEAGIAVLGGSKVPEKTFPLAQAYAGHQFGSFTKLGDGRAILLGEQITPEHQRWDIHLKGAGKTPYSRGGDGRAGLGPMLREYIMSEAMHGLKVPSTRSLAVVKTGEPVRREKTLEGAVLSRAASSHIRVGTFQYARVFGTDEDLKALADYTIWRHDLDLQTEQNPYQGLLKRVIKRQAKLIAKWQLVGFIHGVMNTDNMTISGETIDYGPCAFMDRYDPGTVFSSIDHQARYSYENQPYIGGWNLTRFAETLLPLLHEDEKKAIQLAQDILSSYKVLYDDYFISGMRTKLGIFNEEDGDRHLIESLLEIMKKHHADYTNTFLDLTYGTYNDLTMYQTRSFLEWEKQWKDRRIRQSETEADSVKLMQQSNPRVIPRNYFVEEALADAVENADYSVMERLLTVLENPYADEQGAYRNVPEFKAPYQTFCGT